VTSGKTSRFPCIDGLRALAAVSVVLVHTSFPSGFTTRSHFWGAITARLEIGVAVFFVISGFLLYRPFAAAHRSGEPGPAVGPYLKRRALRIVPAYWVALFCAAYIFHTVGPPIDNWRSIVVYFGFLQIYWGHYILHGIDAAWTLCVEVTFYLFLPVYAAIVGRRRSLGVRAEVAGLVALVAISEAWKLAVFARPTVQQTGAGTWLPAQLDLFALGMLLAVASVWCKPGVLSQRWMPAVCWSGALVTLLVVSHAGIPRVPIYIQTIGQVLTRQSLYGLFAVLLVAPAVFGPQDQGWIRAGLRSRPAVAIGLISYGIYLWHETWMLEFLKWSHQPLFTMSFLTLTVEVTALSLVAATLSYVLVERPAQSLGRPRRVLALVD
jgi:peptidoglycan/LPS O-acetylase OafA/YrhL